MHIDFFYYRDIIISESLTLVQFSEMRVHMYQMIYELDYRRSKYKLDTPGLPSEFKDVLIKIPYTSQERAARLLVALADPVSR